MKTTITTLLILAVAHIATAGESLKVLTETDAKIPQMDLIVLKRSVLLLGTNHKPDAPKFNRMTYDAAEDKLVQYYTVGATELDRVFAEDKTYLDLYRFRYDTEYSTLRNYLGIWKEDYGLEMHFSLVGGGKGVIIGRDGVRDRDTKKQLGLSWVK